MLIVNQSHAYAGAIRKSSPVIVGSLVVMVTALTFAILGSTKHDVKTLIAAILYISGGTIQLYRHHGQTRSSDLITSGHAHMSF